VVHFSGLRFFRFVPICSSIGRSVQEAAQRFTFLVFVSFGLFREQGKVSCLYLDSVGCCVLFVVVV
jgi:hypothetical protein